MRTRKPTHVTDKNLNVQKSSEGEVTYIRPVKKIKDERQSGIDPRKFLNAYFNRIPVDDEHSHNKI